MTQLIAPLGKFRVVGVDTFSHEDWIAGDFDTEKEAIAYAENRVIDEEMLMMHVYNDKGIHIINFGEF